MNTRFFKELSTHFHIEKGIIIILFFSLILLGSIAPFWAPGTGDEGGHMRAAAKAVHGDLLYLGGMYKPVYVSALAGSMLVFGVHDWVGLLPSIVFSLLSIYLVYLTIFSLTKSKEYSWIGALALLFSKLFFYYSRSARPETMISFFFILILYLYIKYIHKTPRQLFLLLGILIGISIWVRNIGIFVLGLVLLCECIKYIFHIQTVKELLEHSFFVSIIPLITTGIGYFIYNRFTPQEQFGGYVTHISASSSIQNVLENSNFLFYSHLFTHEISYIGTICILGGLFFLIREFSKIKKSKQTKYLTRFLWGIIPLALFIVMSIYPLHRFKLFPPLLTLAIIPMIYGVYALSKTYRFSQILQRTILIILLASLAINTIPLLTHSSQSNHEATTFLLKENPEGIITSNYIMGAYFFQFKENGLTEKHIMSILEVNTTEELESLYEQGFRYVYMDYKAWENQELNLYLQEHLEPIYSIPDEAYQEDPRIQGMYKLYKSLKPLDLERVEYITYLPYEEKDTVHITIYDLKELFGEDS